MAFDSGAEGLRVHTVALIFGSSSPAPTVVAAAAATATATTAVAAAYLSSPRLWEFAFPSRTRSRIVTDF